MLHKVKGARHETHISYVIPHIILNARKRSRSYSDRNRSVVSKGQMQREGLTRAGGSRHDGNIYLDCAGGYVYTYSHQIHN